MIAFLFAAATALAGTCPTTPTFTTAGAIDLDTVVGTRLSFGGLDFGARTAPTFDPRTGCPIELTTGGIALHGIDPDEIDVALTEGLEGIDPDEIDVAIVTAFDGIDPDEIDVALRAGVELPLASGWFEQRATVTLARSGRVVGTSGATTGWAPKRAVLYSDGLSAETVHLYLKVTWALETLVIDSPITGATTTAIAVPSLIGSRRGFVEADAP